MSKAGKTLFYFGIYCVVLGFLVVIIPNTILGLFSLPPTDEVWIRIMGVLILALGFYYGMSGLYGGEEMKKFYGWTVFTRSCLIFILSAFVLLGWARPVIILFGVVDSLAAIWTWTALKK